MGASEPSRAGQGAQAPESQRGLSLGRDRKEAPVIVMSLSPRVLGTTGLAGELHPQAPRCLAPEWLWQELRAPSLPASGTQVELRTDPTL